MVEIFQRVNEHEFEVKYGPRRKGDLPSSVLEELSPYMQELYTIDELLLIKDK
jgi:UDP-glucose 4-epimerase